MVQIKKPEEVKFYFLYIYYSSKSKVWNSYLIFILNYNLYLCPVIRMQAIPRFFKKKKIARWNFKKRKLTFIKPKILKNLYLTNLKRYSSSDLLGLISSHRKRWKYTNKYRLDGIDNSFSLLRFKKRKTRKINLLKFSKISFYCFKRIVSRFTITQRLFLALKRLKANMWYFLYKKNKWNLFERRRKLLFFDKESKFSYRKRFKKLYLINANKSLIWKMRIARFAHWSFRTFGKLNEWRYNKLLGWELSKLTRNWDHQMLAHTLLRTYRFVLSWRQMLLLIKYQLIIINGLYYFDEIKINQGDIIELPFRIIKREQSERRRRRWDFIKLVSRARKIAYKSFLRKKNKNVRQSLNVPKIFKRVPVGYKRLGSLLARDKAMNLFSVIGKIHYYRQDIDYEITRSSVLTLQNWRYRFD